MKPNPTPQERAAGFLKVAPWVMLVCVVIAGWCFAMLRPPVWVVAVAAVSGALAALFLLNYVWRPTPKKFIYYIVAVVGVENVTRQIAYGGLGIQSAAFWQALGVFVSVFAGAVFCCLLAWRRALAKAAEDRAAEEARAA